MDRPKLRVLSHFPLQALERVSRQFPEIVFTEVPLDGEVPAQAEGEVLLTFARGSPNLSQALERGVRWVHTAGTGVDGFPLDVVGDRVLTCSRGASAVPIAEWVLAMLLAFEKRLPDAWVSSPPGQWSMTPLGGLEGKTLGLIGAGGIATAVAQRALPFGMRIRAFRRTGRPSPLPQIEIVDEQDELLASADHLVLAAPATPATRHLINAKTLAQVKPGVHLVNIARGSLVDQEALREALDDERVARASLDAVEPEPLPEGHWLYTHPKVRLSPHISWSMPGALPRLLDTFVENLRAYLAGEPLTGVVDVDEGY